MKRYLFILSTVGMLVGVTARADHPTIVQMSASTAPAEMTNLGATSTPAGSSQVTATPEMWFYEQEMRRYDDPRNAIRAAAALKTAQRQARIAAMQWYGQSNSRPLANPDPFHGSYLPGWVSNGYNPNEWVGSSGSTTILYLPR